MSGIRGSAIGDAAQDILLASVEQGRLRGTATHVPEVRSFRGIPYAAPPVGDLRWKAPVRPHAWEGLRDATAFGHYAPQPSHEHFKIMFGAERASPDEDCLHLNVWTPALPGDDCPVMVWIHGGGFRTGSSSDAFLDGTKLAALGVVVVTFNYRLGILGFFAHPDLTSLGEAAVGNFGILDQICALRWVQRNIRAFGGNPDNVTIFGESAGAKSVNYLVASPLAKGLFHKAIAQSGSACEAMPTIDRAKESGEAFARSVGYSLEELRALPTDTLINISSEPRPVVTVDGHVLSEQVITALSGRRHHAVPLLLGFNADEGAIYPPLGGGTAAGFRKEADKLFGTNAERFLELYDLSSDHAAAEAGHQFHRDVTFGSPVWRWARLHGAPSTAPVYFYYFTRRQPIPGASAETANFASRTDVENFGAFHTSEIPYVFGTIGERAWCWTDPDFRLSDIMMRYWVNFARGADPNGGTLPSWHSFGSSFRVMGLGDIVGMRQMPLAGRLEAISALRV